MFHRLLFALLLFVSAPALAQEEATEPASKTPADATDEAAPEKEKAKRGSSLGVGPGLVFWSPPPTEQEYELSLGVALQTRKVFLLGGIVGFEWTNDVVFHDWAAMGAAYSWLFTDQGDGAQALKVSLLWPGIFLIPFGGANYASGIGLVVYTSPSVPAVYFDAGAQLNLYLRLSDPDFRADFAIGAYGGLGYDFLEKVGTSVRVLWGSPLIHGLADKKPRTVVTAIWNLKFSL